MTYTPSGAAVETLARRLHEATRQAVAFMPEFDSLRTATKDGYRTLAAEHLVAALGAEFEAAATESKRIAAVQHLAANDETGTLSDGWNRRVVRTVLLNAVTTFTPPADGTSAEVWKALAKHIHDTPGVDCAHIAYVPYCHRYANDLLHLFADATKTTDSETSR
jgi:hypothetical protein